MIKTPEELQLKYDNIKAFYSQRNINMLAWRDAYFMRQNAIFVDNDGNVIEQLPDEVRVVLPIAFNVVNGMLELLLTKRAAITVPVSTAKGVDLQHAEHNERALLSIWQQADINTRVRDAAWHGLVDGWGALQLVWKPKAEEGETNIVVLHHDPYNVYPMPDTEPGKWRYVIHAFPRKVAQIKDDWLFGDKRKRSTKIAEEALKDLKDTDEVEFLDYWDAEVNAVGISYDSKEKSGAVIKNTKWIKEPTPHGYGFLPWQFYLLGRMPFRTKGEQMSLSVLYPIMNMIALLCRQVSEKASYLSRWEDPPLVTKTEEGQDFEPTKSERGMHIRLRTGEDAFYLVHPGPLPQMDTMVELVRDYIDVSSIPRALQGRYEGAVSGIAMSLLRNPTLMKIAFKQKEIENNCVALNEKILRLLEKKGGKDMYLWGSNAAGQAVDVMIDPDAIAGYYRNEVKLSASLPTDDAGTVNMLATLLQLDVLSRQTTRDVAQQTLHDLLPQSLIDEEKRVLAEKIYQNPEMINTLAMAAAQGINLPYLQEEAEAETPEQPMGVQEETMPGMTLPSQIPGMPGGNTQPDARQRIEEMMLQGPQNPTGGVSKVPEGIM